MKQILLILLTCFSLTLFGQPLIEVISSSGNNTVTVTNYAIESVGSTQYINTGMTIDPNNDDLIIVGSFPGGGLDVAAGGSAEANKRYYIGIGDGGYWKLGWATSGITSSTTLADTNEHTFELRHGGYLYVDNVLIADKSATANTSGTLPLFLFAATTTGNAAVLKGRFKLKSATFKGVTFTPQSNGTLLGSNGTTYTNQGTGSFTVTTY